MPSLIFNSCIYDAMRAQIDFESDEFFVSLVSSDYEPDKAHARRADIGFEVSGEGYAAGGARAQVSLALDPDNENAIEVTLGAARWLRATLTARYALYFKRRGGDPADDELVAVIDFGSDVSSTNGTFSLSESILRILN